MQLDNVIGDVLERRLAINHHVQDTAKGPHIACSADLEGETERVKAMPRALSAEGVPNENIIPGV